MLDSDKVSGPKGWKNIYQVKMSKKKEALIFELAFIANGMIAPSLIVYLYNNHPFQEIFHEVG